MRVGDNIVCINTDHHYLTLNKVYTVVDVFEGGLECSPAIINDNNVIAYYNKVRFITVRDKRDLLISQLGI